MKVSVSLSSARLASWSGVGCALAVIPFVIGTLVHVPLLPTCGCGLGAILREYQLRLLVFLVPFACGMTISMVAEKRLRRGFKNDVWQESEVELLRRRLVHPAWSILVALTLVTWFVHAVVASHGLLGFGTLMFPMQTISRLKMMVGSKQVARGGVLQDWRNFKPIQSEHWGEPRRDSLSL